MNKQQHFITAVQTGVIIRSTLTPKPNPADTMYHALGIIEDAIDASQRIPEGMSANEAACELLGYLYDMPERERDPDAVHAALALAYSPSQCRGGRCAFCGYKTGVRERVPHQKRNRPTFPADGAPVCLFVTSNQSTATSI